MSTLGGVVVVVVAVVLLVVAIVLARSRRVTPWPAIVVAALASGVAFTVGGDSGRDATEPSVATVTAAVAGILTVVAAVLALIPRVAEPPLAPLPRVCATVAVVVAAAGLVVNLLVS
jgi:hypothetical protein